MKLKVIETFPDGTQLLEDASDEPATLFRWFVTPDGREYGWSDLPRGETATALLERLRSGESIRSLVEERQAQRQRQRLSRNIRNRETQGERILTDDDLSWLKTLIGTTTRARGLFRRRER